MNRSSKVLLGLIGAAAAGAAVGMLLAPQKGKDIRKKVKEAANDWACQVADMFAESKSELKKLTHKANKNVKEMQANAEEKYNKVKESLS
ncbi:MAG: YtxH domain-containing protein [Chitinophagaceae bacterium]|nr:YtxH domain-containing protein [Chitinophagaceae bacterium]